MKGWAYVFLRKDGAPVGGFYAGHVGWAFEVGAGRVYCGSTENTRGLPVVAPGDDNGAWAKELPEEELGPTFAALNYDGYKIASVRNPQPEAARPLAEEAARWGYTAIGNNCL